MDDGWAMGHILGEDDTDFQYLLTDVPGAPILMPTNDYMNKSWLTWSIQSSRGRRAINGLEDPARPGRVIPSKSIYEYYSENSGYLGLCNRSFIDDYPDWVDSLNRNLGRAENFHDHIGTASNIYAHPVTYEIASHQEQTLISTQLRETSANTRRFTFTDRDDLEVDLNIDLRGDGTVPLASERALQNQAGVREAVLFDNIEHSQIFANDNVINYVCDVVERLAIEYRGSVYFALNSDSLDNDNKERLRNSIIPLLADPANSSLRLKAIGWSSCSGPDGYNQQLSERRANNTVQFIKQELATLTSTSASDWDSRFEISARGEETRAANTPQEQQKSRRVDFRRI